MNEQHRDDRSGTSDIINGQLGWRLENRNVDLFVTERGGHIAPVYFYNDTDIPVQPYYISPWQDEGLELDEAVLTPLRGDFFCMPFGGNVDEYEEEKHPVHGEAAGSAWDLKDVVRGDGRITMELELNTHISAGKITKQISLIDGHNVIYTRHLLSGYGGRMPLGHHAILAMPEEADGLLLSLGQFDFGMTHPAIFSNPAAGEYQQLAYGKEFTDLHRMPLLWQEPVEADYSRFPSPVGFADLFCVLKHDRGVPSWATAVFPRHGFLWFALKSAALLPATCVWVENHGRYSTPWNGRNSCIGIEDVCAYFAYGLKQSVESNIFNEKGFPTSVELDPGKMTAVSYIQGVARTPAGFGEVVHAEFEPGRVVFFDRKGAAATAEVDYSFLGC